MNIKDFIPVDWRNQRVLTSAQLAEAYGCSVARIKDNFNANKQYYIEGIHYFKITGSDLQNLRDGNSDLQISPKTRVLYLWTYQGCVRHCKSINTLKAWEMFDELEKNYFNQPHITPFAEPAPVVEEPLDICRVYLFLLSDGTVKIGLSKRFCSRIGEVKREINRRRKAAGKEELTFKDVYFTPKMTCEDARLVEFCFKEIFSEEHIEDEIFSVAFKTARAKIKYLVKLSVAALPNQSVNLIADKQD